MSWVCEFCSTTNEDGDSRCFVCDSERTGRTSREEPRVVREEPRVVREEPRVVREEPRVVREEPRRVVHEPPRRVVHEPRRTTRTRRTSGSGEKVYRVVVLAGKILCLSSIIVFALAALVMLFLKMSSGSLDDLINMLIAVFDNLMDNISRVFRRNVRALLKHLGDFFRYLWYNLEPVFSVATGNIRSQAACIAITLFDNKDLKYELLGGKIEVISLGLRDLILRFFTLVSVLFAALFKIIKSVVQSLGRVIERIIDAF